MKQDETAPSDRDLADALMFQGRPAEAVPIYRKLVAANPDEDSHLLALAWALHDSGQMKEAADRFEQIFRKELSRKLFTGFAYDELVRIYRQGKNGKALISVCERAVDAQPDDIGLLRTLGEAYLSTGKVSDAVRVFEKLIEIEPYAPEHLCSLGDSLLAAGNPDRSEALYTKAAMIDPSSEAVLFSRLANGLCRAGYPLKAKGVWEKCVAVCPDEPVYWMGLGDCLISLDDPDAAIACYGNAAALRPETAGSCWYRLGKRFLTDCRNVHASAAFARAVTADPANGRFYLSLAESYIAQGRDDLAADIVSRLENLPPPAAH